MRLESSTLRAHPRYAVEVDAELRYDGVRMPARTKDLSKGGLCFAATQALAIGTDVTLSLALVFDEKTFSEPLVVRARVVWCTALAEARHQIGTTFVNLTNEQRAYLDLFLRYLKDGAEKAARRAAAAAPAPARAAGDGDEDDDKGVFGA